MPLARFRSPPSLSLPLSSALSISLSPSLPSILLQHIILDARHLCKSHVDGILSSPVCLRVLCVCVCCVCLWVCVCVCVWEGRSPHYLAGNLLLNASFVGSKWGTIKQVQGVSRWRGEVGSVSWAQDKVGQVTCN